MFFIHNESSQQLRPAVCVCSAAPPRAPVSALIPPLLGAGLPLAAVSVGTFFTHQSHANGNGKPALKAAVDTNGHSCQDQHSQQQPVSPQDQRTSKWTWAGYLLLLAITKYTLPDQLRTSNPTVQHVWFYGWVTALSTGAGAAPLIFAHDMGKAMLAFGNAVAAGMMLSASYSLVAEGATVVEPEGFTGGWGAGLADLLSPPWARVVLGVLAGLVFILSTKKVPTYLIVCWIVSLFSRCDGALDAGPEYSVTCPRTPSAYWRRRGPLPAVRVSILRRRVWKNAPQVYSLYQIGR